MEFGYTSLSFRSMFGTNNGIAGKVLVNYGTDEQKQEWLERLASGEVVASFCFTEDGAGSNPAGLRTTAVREGDHWTLNGHKRFITNAPGADLFITFARTRPKDADGAGIAVFLVPADTPRVSVGPKDVKTGQQGAPTAEVHFENVRVPASSLVGGDEDIGYRAAMSSLARGRIHIAALAVGTAQRALDESVAYAATATQGGQVLGDFQLVQAVIADQQTGVLARKALVRDAAQKYESGADTRIAPSAAKLYRTDGRGRRRQGRADPRRYRVHARGGRRADLPECAPAQAVRGHQ